MSGSEPYILVFGASVVDIFGFSKAKFRQYNSTPGRVKMSFGGVCRNIAENMARVGINTQFISILGDDEKGRRMLDHAEVIGYDMTNSLVLKDGGTPTYLAILDEKGVMVSAIADLDSIHEMNTEFIDSKATIFENAEYVVVDSDDPEILEYVLTKFGDKTKFVLDPVSAEKAKNVKHLVKYFHTIKPNRFEAEKLLGFEIKDDSDLVRAARVFHEEGVEKVFISLDEDGIFYSDGIDQGKIKAMEVTIKNVTGAGDAFVAGLGYGYYNDVDIVETVKFAIAMANIAIAHEETINPDMKESMVRDYMKTTEWVWESFKHTSN